jgi:HSP20 family protein
MARKVRKPKQSFFVAEDNFGQTKSAFEFQFQDSNGIQSTWSPNMDIFETDEQFVILLEAAGLQEDSLQLHAVDNRLILNGERKPMVDDSVVKYHQLEIQCMPFQKTIILPGKIDVNQVKASYKNGMFRISVSKDTLNKG